MKTKRWKGFTNISNGGKHAQDPAWEDTPFDMDGCLLKWNHTCILIYKRPCVCGQFRVVSTDICFLSIYSLECHYYSVVYFSKM